ncbi:MAG: hypothetical protein ACRBFS_24170 [Aureispira sp.]
MAKKIKKHRGRIQAQGGGVEESESWAQDEPLKISKARLLFRLLIAKLSPKEQIKRQKAFDKAEQFAEQASKTGGAHAKLNRSFKVFGSKDERVDIEVISGKAFIKSDRNQ